MARMRGTTPAAAAASALRLHYARFVAERYPYALEPCMRAFEAAGGVRATTPEAVDAVKRALGRHLNAELAALEVLGRGLGEVTPRVPADLRIEQAVEEIVQACEGLISRFQIARALAAEERRELLRGMLLTRATDNRLKMFFAGGEIRHGGAAFQGKGFRSLGQEAIYGAGLRLRRGERYRGPDGTWQGDVVAPVIRDLGVALAMAVEDPGDMVRRALSAQMAKAGPPMEGKDLHVGHFDIGVLPATAPLAIGTLTLAGMAYAFAREATGRVAVSFIGEGGTSLGEWHEAINACAAHRLPAVFCVENNQTALSTPVREQSAARLFADKAAGYGIPGITIDGTDPDEVAAAFAWAVDRAREGLGPTLIELVCLRICGHAHHDDMLYLGREPQVGWSYPALAGTGYASPELFEYWSARDPIEIYAAQLHGDGLLSDGELDGWKREIAALVEAEARAVIDGPWPDRAMVGQGVFFGEPARVRVDPLAPAQRARASGSRKKLLRRWPMA